MVDLNELDVEHFNIREVLHCIMHTISFHRDLGLVRPKDVVSELFEIWNPNVGFTEIWCFATLVVLPLVPCLEKWKHSL